MECILFYILSFFLLIFLFIKVWKYSEGLTLNYISIWFLCYILFCLCGAFLIISNLVDDTYFIKEISNLPYIKFYGSLIIVYSGVATFFVFFGCLFLVNGKVMFIWKNNIKTNIKSEHFFIVNFLFFIFIIIFLYYQFVLYPTPLIMAFLKYNPIDIALRRIEITKNLTEHANVYVISLGFILGYIVSYGYISIYAISKRYLLSTIISILIFSIFLISTGEKGPFVFYILGCFLSFYYSQGKKLKVSLKLILGFVVLCLLIYYIMVSKSLGEIYYLFLDRVFIAQIVAVYYSFLNYSSGGDLGISTISNYFTKLLNIQTAPPASEELMKLYFPEMIQYGGWNINGFFPYEAWSNYGLLGLLISPAIVGILNAVSLIIFMYTRKTVITVAFYCYCSINVTFFLTSFNAYLYHSNIIIILITIFMILFLKQIYGILSYIGRG